jgi:EAL domain-containing protein (putative c-di-GMP-specific phosphodiesterase class I)
MINETDQQGTANKLIEALKQDRFIVYCQSIKAIDSVKDEGGFQEILVRFVEEEEKLLHPGGFFPVLESFKLMATLDRWVVNRVLRWSLAKNKAQKNWNIPRSSINLSIDSIVNSGFSEFVRQQLQASRLPSGKLSFEVPEPDAEACAIELEQLIAELKPLGCSFTITGYNGESISAEMLQALGVSFVKIDGRLVNKLHRDDTSVSRVSDIHRSCQTIGIRTIGELVELPETLQKLKELGVNYAQGYGISKPGPLGYRKEDKRGRVS